MECPMTFNQQTHLPDGERLEPGYHCIVNNCAWWNDRFGMCCITVNAYLKGVEDRWQEQRDERD